MILISGATGLVGSRLTQYLDDLSVPYATLSANKQRKFKQTNYFWDYNEELSPQIMEGITAVIHLAGENVGQGRWSVSKKHKIEQSRVNTTRLLKKAISQTSSPPRVFVSASGTDYYPNPSTKIFKEEDLPGNSFLSRVCQHWEAEVNAIGQYVPRVVSLRTGIVLSAHGGFLKETAIAAPFGIYPIFGSRKNHLSWIHIDDLVKMYYQAVTGNWNGAYNAVAPGVCTIAELAAAYQAAKGKHWFKPVVPDFAVRAIFGEKADILLTDQRVSAEKATASGFQFEHPEIGEALKHLFR